MQLQHERNFHIFYQLLSCPKQVQRYCLRAVKDYRYVNQSGVETIRGVNDAKELELTTSCMRNIGFADEQIA